MVRVALLCKPTSRPWICPGQENGLKLPTQHPGCTGHGPHQHSVCGWALRTHRSGSLQHPALPRGTEPQGVWDEPPAHMLGSRGLTALQEDSPSGHRHICNAPLLILFHII
jgi:hypothetical protein